MPLCFLMRAFHGPSQVAVDSRLITLTLPLNPREYVGINPNRQRLFDWPVKLSHDKLFVTGEFRNVGEINVLVFHAFQCTNLLSLTFCELHKSSLHTQSHIELR